MQEEDARPVVPGPSAGEDLATLSVEELTHRIAVFEQEIARLKAEIEAKQSSREAADSVFKL